MSSAAKAGMMRVIAYHLDWKRGRSVMKRSSAWICENSTNVLEETSETRRIFPTRHGGHSLL